MENPGYFAVLTAAVRYDSQLSAAEKIFFAEITALSNVEGYCYASNAYFANLYSVDNRTIQRWLRNLVHCGYVQVTNQSEGHGGKIGRKIIPLFDVHEVPFDPRDKNVTPHDKNVAPPGQKCHIPHDKNVTQNNKKNNKKNNNTRTREEADAAEQIFRDFAGEDDQLLDALVAFRTDRAERRKPMTTLACKLLCSRLNKLADEAEVHDRSGYMQHLLCVAVEFSWQTVYARGDFTDRADTHQPTGPAEDRPRVVDANTDVMDIL